MVLRMRYEVMQLQFLQDENLINSMQTYATHVNVKQIFILTAYATGQEHFTQRYTAI